MKAVTLAVLVSLLAVPAWAQGDAKAQLAQAVAAAQKAYDAGLLDDAESILREHALAVHEDYKAVLLRAQTNYYLQDYGRAYEFARRAAELDAKSFDAQFLVALAMFQRAEEARMSPTPVDSRVKGFYNGTIAEAAKCLKLKDGNVPALILKGRAESWLGMIDEALATLAAARKADPESAEVCLHLAQTQLAAGKADEAMRTVTEGLTSKGPSAFRGGLAQLLFSTRYQAGTTDQKAEVAKTFQTWLANHPKDPQAYLYVAYLKGLTGDVDEALGLYEKGFEVSGKQNVGCALEIARLVHKKGDLEKAATWYGTAARLQPYWPDYDGGPYIQLAVIAAEFVKKRDYAKAVEILEKHALPAGDEVWQNHSNLGLFLRDWADSGKKSDARPRNEKALKHYLRASELVLDDPNVAADKKAQVLNDTGVIYHYQLDNIEKGIEYYERAIAAYGELGDPLENLGVCFNILGKYAEAVPLFEKVLQNEPNRGVSRAGLETARKALKKG